MAPSLKAARYVLKRKLALKLPRHLTENKGVSDDQLNDISRWSKIPISRMIRRASLHDLIKGCRDARLLLSAQVPSLPGGRGGGGEGGFLSAFRVRRFNTDALSQ